MSSSRRNSRNRGGPPATTQQLHTRRPLLPPFDCHLPFFRHPTSFPSAFPLMGSACCTAARSRDHSCPTDGWSLDQSGHGYLRRTPSVSLHPRWPGKSFVYDTPLDETCTFPPHRSSFSSSRSCSSFGGLTVSSTHQHESMDGVLGVFSSPTESLYHSLNETSDPVFMHTDSSTCQRSQKSGAHLNQESAESPSASSFSSTFRWGRSLSVSKNLEKGVEAPVSSTANDFGSTESELHQRRNGYSIDGLPSNVRKRTDPWKSYMLPELGSSRLSNVDACHEDFLESHIGRLGMINHREYPSMSLGDRHKCGLCTKGISKKSPWSLSRLPGSKELPVVGILDCGHVYHADCLDRATPVIHAHDPPCPKCGPGKIENNEDVILNGVEFLNLHSTLGRYKSSEKCSNSLVKGTVSASTQIAGRSFAASTLLRKQFALRGKLTRDTQSGSKRPGYPTRVSPENSRKDDDIVDRERKVPIFPSNRVQ